VLHSGFVRHVPMTLGQAVVLFSFVVLVLWIPLREVPGLGTISNALVVGFSADLTLAVLDRPDAIAARIALMIGGVALCGLASALYIGAQLGRGPRDGLMTGLSRRTGLSLRLVRTGLEITVVVLGLLLGGALGFGTVLYALGIGPLTQLMLPYVIAPVSVRDAVVSTSSTNEEVSTTNEEVSTTNEEVSTTNEEVSSTNEEVSVE
jgi:uncharacterized membrane protein YczE